jgi:hypothetical protein
MTANQTTHGDAMNPRSGDAKRAEDIAKCGSSEVRVTASISKTEAGEVLTRYEVGGRTVTNTEAVEAALRGDI